MPVCAKAGRYTTLDLVCFDVDLGGKIPGEIVALFRIVKLGRMDRARAVEEHVGAGQAVA